MAVTVAEPGATPVKETLQLPLKREQLAPTVPTDVADDVKLTVPVGVLAELVVSEIAAVHVETPPMPTLLGVHTREVDELSSDATLYVTLI